MYLVPSAALEVRRRTANKVIPGWVPGLLGALQTILWLAIMGLEGASVYYDAGRGTIYAGFWCSGFFLITWISMFCFLCCGKSNCCGVFLIVMNSISLIFSIVLVAFTTMFINNYCLCYGRLCSIPPYDIWNSEMSFDSLSFLFTYKCTPRTLAKMPYLKGLLACAVLMVLSNLAYIVTYIGISIWLRSRANTDIKRMNATYQKQSASVDFGHQQQYPPTSNNYPSQTGERSYPAYPMNGGYRQPSPKKPVSKWQPSQYDDVDDGRF